MGADIEPGALVGEQLGKYELLALIAVGGTAEIYLARIGGEAGFEKYVVVKCLHDHLVHESEYVDMFLDEARLGAQLDHSNIVQTLELGEHKGRYYMVMEFLAGLSVAQIGRSAYDRVAGGLIPADIVLGLAAQASVGLHYAHERTSGGQPLNIVHRDISPQNLVVSFDGVLKIVDFGIAKAERRRTQTESGTIKGKFAYMSPEQCMAEDIDRRTDVFALGTIVHELLTGRRLFKRGSTYETYQAIVQGGVPAPSSINPQLDEAIDRVVLKALAYDRRDRYDTAEAFGEALLGLVHARGGSASASDVADFFERHFAVEIEEHAEQMREVIAGKRQHATGTWDTRDLGSDRVGASDRPSSQFIDELARDRPAAAPAGKRQSGGQQASRPAPPKQGGSPDLRALAQQPSDDFEDNAETQIELDPMSGFAGGAAAPEPDRRDSAPTHQVPLQGSSPSGAPGGAAAGPKRTQLLGTPAVPPHSEADLEARDTDEQPQSSSTLFRPDGAPPPSPAAARPSSAPPPLPGTPNAGAPAAATPAPSQAGPEANAGATPTPTPTPARPARQLSAADASPSPVAVALAFLVSAAVGFGATLLAGQILG